MKNRTLIPLAGFAVLASALAYGHSPKAPKGLSCPVTRLALPSAQAAVAKESYKGKTYYFCTMNCKKVFDKNRAKYSK